MRDMAGFAANPRQQICAKENKKVQKRGNGQQSGNKIQLQQSADDIKSKQGGVQPGKPFDFYRNDQQEHGHFRIKHGEGEKHGHINIVGAGEGVVNAGHKGGDDDKHQGDENTAKEENVEFGGAPFPLQCGADKIIEK